METIVNNCTVNGQVCPLCAEFGNVNGTQERHYVNGLLSQGYSDKEIKDFLDEEEQNAPYGIGTPAFPGSM